MLVGVRAVSRCTPANWRGITALEARSLCYAPGARLLHTLSNLEEPTTLTP